METDESLLTANLARKVATDNSPESEANALLARDGYVDSAGNDVSPAGQEEKQKRQQAHAAQIQSVFDKAKETPKPDTISGVIPDPRAIGNGIMDLAGKAASATKQAFLEQTDNNIKEKDMLGPQIMGGVASAVQSAVNMGNHFSNWVKENVGMQPEADLNFADRLFPKSDLQAGHLVRSASQFLTAFVPLAEMGVPKTIAEFAAGYIGFEGGEKNLSNLIQSQPGLANPVNEFLMAKPSDTDAEGRLKTAVELTGLGVMAEGIFRGIKFLKGQRMAKEGLQVASDLEAGLTTQEAVAKKYTPDDIPSPAVEGKVDVNLDGQKTVFPSDQANIDANKLPQSNLTPQDILTPPTESAGKGGGAMPNLTKIDAIPEVLNTIQTISESDRAAIEARIPDMTHEQIRTGPLSSMKKLMNKPQGYIFNEQELYSLRVYNSTAAEQVMKLAKSADQTPKGKFDFMQALEASRQLNATYAAGKARPGQLLNSLGMKVGPNELMADHINNFIALHGEKEIGKVMDMVAKMDATSFNKFVTKSYSRRVFDAALETFVNNLFTTGTYMKKAISDTTIGVATLGERMIAPYMDVGEAQVVNKEILRDTVARRQALMNTTPEELAKLTNKERALHDADLARANDILNMAISAKHSPREALVMGQEGLAEGARQIKAAYQTVAETLSGIRRSFGEGKGAKNLVELVKGTPETDPNALLANLPQAMTSENLGLPASHPLAPVVNNFIDVVGGISRLNSKPLSWIDHSATAVNYRMELISQAERIADQMELSGVERAQFTQEYMKNPPDSVNSTGKINRDTGKFEPPQNSAKYEALKRTLKNPLESELAQNTSQFIRSDFLGGQWLRFLQPFDKVMLNIPSYAWDRAPLRMLTSEYAQKMAQGGATAQLAKAQVLFGTSLMGATSLMYLSGHIRGGPQNKEQAQTWKQLGLEPYSIQMFDRQIPFSHLEPFGTLLGLVTDINQASGMAFKGELTSKKLGELASMTVLATVKHFSAEQLVDNFGKVFDAIESGDASKLSGNITSNLIPGTGVAKHFRGVDEVQRDVHADPNSPWPWLQEMKNGIFNEIPGLSKNLPAQKNIFAEEVTYPHGLAEDIVNPFWGKPDKKDPLTKELVRLGYLGGRGKRFAQPGETYLELSLPSRSLHSNSGSVDLTPEEYSRYMDLAAGKGLKYSPYGRDKTLKQAMSEMVTKNYPYMGSGEMFKTDQNKRNEISTMINRYREAAKNQMLMEDKEISRRMRQSQTDVFKARGVVIP